MSQALYRKYRSRKLSEIIGQPHITQTLENALKKGQVSHAYLLTGPRGTGKTSIARILAHEINDLPYDSDDTHLDIIEIDAASNRRIDEIRDLREKAMLAPTSAKYKVYIIDEVHMLTREAFNALLKTLEEPPAHVIFILATTELHKLPETIISRTQRFGLKPISNEDLVSHLRTIAEKESIDIDDDALGLIAAHARGGFRDAISLLDQLSGMPGRIGVEAVEAAIGVPSGDALAAIVKLVEAGDGNGAIEALASVLDQGFNAGSVAAQLIHATRDRVVGGGNPDRLVPFLDAVLQASSSANPRIALELALMKSVPLSTREVAEPPKTPKHTPVTHPAESTDSTTPASPKKSPPKTLEAPAEESPTKPIPPSADTGTLWPDTLDAMKGNHNTLYGVLRMAEAVIDENNRTITLLFQFPFHMKRASEAKHQQIIADTIKKLAGHEYRLLFNKQTRKEVADTPDTESKKAKDDTSDKSKPDDPLDTVLSVFGGGEVMR